jgi:anti-anti-sigma factor
MEITGENYSISYDQTSQQIIFNGSLRLDGNAEYALISDLLNQVAQQEPQKIVLDLAQLSFLNSSGISVISRFVIDVRKRQNIQMTVIGSQKNPWQGKSLKNLQRLMPSLQLDLK